MASAGCDGETQDLAYELYGDFGTSLPRVSEAPLH